ncbi:MAG: oxidoreductase, partial [Microcystis panniformis]
MCEKGPNHIGTWPKPFALLSNRDRYARHGWSAEATYGLNPEDSLLLVGTGLTMADVVVALRSQGFQGQIHAVSRHGLRPHSHQVTSPYPAFIDLETAPKTTRGLLHLVRQEVRSAQAQ